MTPHITRLQVGQPAPAFQGKDQHGNTVRLSDFAGQNLILYFYPKDDTPGCTATSCNLRDEYQYLQKEGYAVVGVSADDQASHKQFAEKYNLPFPLIADTGHKLISDYDVWGLRIKGEKMSDGIVRTTFVIGPEGTLKKVITDVDKENHARQVTSA